MGCFKQALLVLAHLWKNETLAQVGAGFGVSEATAWRYVHETVEVLASWTPGLHEALAGLGEDDFVIVDGTLIPTDRIRADDPYCSQKHRKHGMNVQVIERPAGTPLWFSRATPGRTHDLTAARTHDIVQACLSRQILAWPTGPTREPAPPSAPPTTAAAACPSTTSAATATTHVFGRPANAPSLASNTSHLLLGLLVNSFISDDRLKGGNASSFCS